MLCRMKLLVLFCCIGFAMAACSGRDMYRTSARPPATRLAPVTDALHGSSVVDNYRWLEGDNADSSDQGKVTPEVAAWTDAQNSYTRAVLDNLPGRSQLEDRLRPLMEVGVVTAPQVRGNRYFFSRREGNQNQPVIYWREGYKGTDKVLIDPAKLDATGLTTVEWVSPANNGKLVAYGTYRAGDENTTLHLLDVDSGVRPPFEIPDKTQAAQWLPDDSGFVYQNLKNPKDPYSGQVLFHRMGADRRQDQLLDRQFTKAENEKLSTTWGPFGSLSKDGRWLLLGYWVDTKSNDLWLVNFDSFRRTGRISRTVVSVGKDGLASGTVIGDTLYLQTTKGAPQGRVVAAPAATPDEAHWRDLIPARADAVVESVSFAKGLIVVTYLKNAANVVEVFDLAGKSLGIVSQPGIGSAGVAVEEDRTEAYLTFTSFNYPTTIFRVDVARPSGPPGAVGTPRGAGRSGECGSGAGLVSLEGWHQDQHVPGAQEGTREERAHADAAQRLRRFQRQHDAGVLRVPVSVVRRRRHLCGAQPAGRRRIRRRVARGRYPRPQAERLRRFHRRGRVADRQQIHES